MLINSCLPFEVSQHSNRYMGEVLADLLCEQRIFVDRKASGDDTKSSSGEIVSQSRQVHKESLISCPRSDAAVRIHT